MCRSDRDGRVELVDVAAIDWIEAADNYVVLHAGGRTHVLRETMARLEQRLDPEQFVRIHRSAIVRLDRVVRLESASRGDYDVTLRDGTRLTLSRTMPGPARTRGRDGHLEMIRAAAGVRGHELTAHAAARSRSS